MRRDEEYLTKISIELLQLLERSETATITVKLERHEDSDKYLHHLFLLVDRGYLSTVEQDLKVVANNASMSFRITDAGHDYLQGLDSN